MNWGARIRRSVVRRPRRILANTSVGKDRSLLPLVAVAWLWVLLLLLPCLTVFLAWFFGRGEVWHHLAQTQLWGLLGNTLLLAIGVLTLAGALGTGLAWLNACCEYPGRRWLDPALALPLAIPSYVLAFVILGMIGFGGPLQQGMAALMGDSFFPWEARRPEVVIAVLSLAFYPYVYLLMRVSFLLQGTRLLEAARSLGLGSTAAFFRVVLPASRPALVGGGLLVLMETLAEFGAVSVFNYATFTTAIYHVWFGLAEPLAAAQLASLLLLLAFVVIVCERATRPRGHYTQPLQAGPPVRIRLTGGRAALACAVSVGVFSLAFLLPILQLLYWSIDAWSDVSGLYLSLMRNSFSLAAMVVAMTVLPALFLVCLSRWQDTFSGKLRLRLAGLGYALPGTVLAVGMVVIGGAALRWLPAEGVFGLLRQPLVPGGIFLLLLACTVRFTAPALNTLESSLLRIRGSMTQAARSLGAGSVRIVWRIYIPLLLPALAAAAAIVFVEVMREMPATLLLRPFGWNTLAVRVYEMSSEGEWRRAAPPAVTLVLLGLLPVFILLRQQGRALRPGSGSSRR